MARQARPFLDFFMQHRDIVFDLCRKHSIDCDAVKSGMVEASGRKRKYWSKRSAAGSFMATTWISSVRID